MENSGPSLKEEFRLTKFGLAYPDPDVFVRSQWHQSRWFYLIWRLFWFLWHVGWIIASGITTRNSKARFPEEGAKWFIYFTNMTLLLTTLTSTADLTTVLYVIALRGGTVLDLPRTIQKQCTAVSSQDGSSLDEEIIFRGQFTVDKGLKMHTSTWYLKLLWLMYNVISSCNIVITVVYWVVGYHAASSDVVSVEVHTINTAFIILNLMVTAMPVHMLHFIYPTIYAALYCLFNYIYTAAGGTDLSGRAFIYSFIDWGKPFPTAVVVTLGILLAVPVGHVLLFAIYTLRVFVYSKVNSASYSLRDSCIRLTNRTADVSSANGIENIEMTNSTPL
ncbi:hypothetical protein BsWGS_13419 [Bradybaena similaris]